MPELIAYPRRALRPGDARVDVVRQLQARLNQLGCGPVDEDGVFGNETKSAVLLFQTRRALTPDGVVGPATWAELFGAPAPVHDPASPLLREALAAARTQIDVRELSANRGPEVDGYLRAVGLDPERGQYPWCAAFVYWCFARASEVSGTPNPCVRTAGCLDHWVRSPAAARVSAEAALDDPALVAPGSVFIVDHGHGKGHTGLVARVEAGVLVTLEGNTNPGGSREGDGVYERRRPIAAINTGFLDYARA